MAQADRIHDLLLELENPTAPHTRGQLLARALRTAGALVDADAAAIVMASARRATERMVLHAGSELPAILPLVAEGSEALRVLAGATRTIAFADLTEQSAFAEGDACPGVEAGPVLFAPIARADREPAYLAVYRRRGRARFTAGETQSVLLLTAWLGAALERRRLAARPSRPADADALDAASDREFRAELKREIRRAHRHGQELSLVLVAPDGSADRSAIADLLETHLRDIDLLARTATRTIAILLPQTGRDGGRKVAERMRGAIVAHAFTPQAAGKVTATLGVATFPHDGVDLETLWAVTERVLRDAQHDGGDRVAVTERHAA